MFRAIASGLVILLLSVAVPAGAGPGKPPGTSGEPPKAVPGGPSGRGWGPFAVKGTISTIAPAASTFTLSVENALPGRGNPNAPGQQKKISTAPGTSVVVHVIAGQTLIGVGRNTVPFGSLVVGDRVQVWGAAQADGTVAAVRVQLLGRARGPLPTGTPPPSPPPSTPGTTHGVIVAMSGLTFTLVTDAGTTQAVTASAATTVREGGQVVGPGALHPYDIVQVSGTASGTALTASAIDVEFDSATAAQVAGPIGFAVPAVEGIMVGATIVGVHSDTFIIQGTTRLSFGALTPGRTVTVYGTSVRIGGLPFGIQARVVVVQ